LKNWTNLHNHTVYSTLDGHGDIEKYLSRAKSLGMSGLATTDHGNIHSWLDFYDAGKATGVNPILGSEFYQARKTRFDRDEEERSGPAKYEWQQRGPYHLTVLAKNYTGYKNIIKMSSKSFLEGYFAKPRIDHDLISQHSDGIIVLSGCLNSEVCQALLRDDYEFALSSAKKMQDIVGKENYFIELQDHGLAEQRKVFNSLIDIARKIDAKLVPTGDCHYVNKDDAHFHDVMLCVGTNSTIHTENRFSFSGDHFYLHSYEEMEKLFNEEWLRNTMIVNDMVDLNLDFGELYFPNFPIPTQEDSITYFERLAWEGLKKKYGDPLPQHIIDRALYEIRVVKEMGFPEYFLVVSDLVRWAKNNNIRVGWGRGSAAGSILSYAFEITNLDPIRFGLMFERFLVEGRKSPPDIDLDFDDRHREEVINYARSKYGDDRVAHICTFNKTGARQSIRDSARALGYDYIVGDKIAKLIPPPVLGVSKTLKECMEVDEFAKAYDSQPESKHVIDTAFGLEGLIRQTGIHAAGVVISRDPLIEYLPIMQKGADKPLVTQWDMGRVEQCGLLKIDFLGLRNLGVIDLCIEMVRKRRGIEIDLDQIPLDDKKTFDELCQGNCAGVFQLESSSMREMMLALQPKTIEDIMALISLHRPGPMGSGMDKIYIDRKHGRVPIDYDHPKMKNVLEKSLGIMLYQEDVLAVSRELAGFSSAEADDLRKVIGKKQMEKIPKMRKKFVDGCKEYSDIDQKLADKIFSDIEYFGGYGFNLSHAASYSMISYVTGYLKANYPVEYMAALMSSVVDNKEKQAFYLSECRKLGIEVSPPSINFSNIDFDVIDDKTIIFGLSAINGIGYAVAEQIIECRDNKNRYQNIYDFYRRCDPVILKKNTLEHLAASGCFDEFFELDEDRDLTRNQQLEILELERTELGMYVLSHPVEGVWDILSSKIDSEIIGLSEMREGSNVKIGGIIGNLKPIMTKKGSRMYKFTVEDISSEVEVIVFPNSAKSIPENYFSNGEIVIISGTIAKETDEDNSSVKIYFSSCEKIDNKVLSGGKALVYKVDKSMSSILLAKIYDIIEKNNGDRPVFLEYIEDKHKYMFRFNKTTNRKVQQLIQDLIDLEV
jgi:DNA polymerase-3 subunit alpha